MGLIVTFNGHLFGLIRQFSLLHAHDLQRLEYWPPAQTLSKERSYVSCFRSVPGHVIVVTDQKFLSAPSLRLCKGSIGKYLVVRCSDMHACFAQRGSTRRRVVRKRSVGKHGHNYCN